MIESQVAYVLDALRHMDAHGADTVRGPRARRGRLQRRDRRAHGGHGLEHRLRELVPRRDRPQRDAVAGLDVALPPADRAASTRPSSSSSPRARRRRAGDGVSARVLITGAAGGIGSAAMAELRSRGATRRRARPRGRRGADVLACDVRDQARSTRAVAEAIERLGGLDVLINNAGLGAPQSAGKRARRRRAGGARGQPDRPVARDRRRAARAARVARARGQRRLRARPPRGPVRDRVLHEQARAGRLLRRAAARARRRDHRDHRLPRLHPHRHPRRVEGERRRARGRGARPSRSRTRRGRSRARRSGARCATSRRRARARSSTSSPAARRGGCSTR